MAEEVDIKELTDPATPVEHRQKILRGLIGGIPGIGSIITEYLPDIRSKKMTEFIIQLSEELEELKDLLKEDYLKREDVISIVEKSFKSLYETYDVNKISALKNALIRTIIDTEIDVDRKDFYINLLNSLSPFHFRILNVFYNTEEYLKSKNITVSTNVTGGRSSFLQEALPSMTEDEIKLTISDLVSKGLAQNISLGALQSTSGTGALKGFETKFGREFMNFFSKYKK